MPDPDQPTRDDDAVRRLLAEARHDEPVPPEVAERLDVLLGRLVEERERSAGASAGADVVDLGSRRHRGRLLVMVAAAAAVVAIGVGTITGVADRVTSGSDSTSSAGSAADSEADSQADAEPGAEAGSSAAPERPTEGEADGDAGALAAPQASPPLVLTSAGLAEEAAAALRSPASSEAYDSRLDLAYDDCAPPAGAAYVLVRPATYDAQPGVLAAAAPDGDRQRVDVFLCGGTEPVRSVTVDAPR